MNISYVGNIWQARGWKTLGVIGGSFVFFYYYLKTWLLGWASYQGNILIHNNLQQFDNVKG